MTDPDDAPRARFRFSQLAIYGALVLWAAICLFPIYWTVSTSFKTAPDVTQGHLVPFVDFAPDWRGWRSLGLSPDTIGEISTPRDEFMKRFMNSAVVAITASLLAVVLGSLAAYGLSRFSYRFAWMRNKDISFFFLSSSSCRRSSSRCPSSSSTSSSPSSTPASASSWSTR